MITRLSNLLKDQAALSKITSALFILGILLSIYMLLNLPHQLSLSPLLRSGEFTFSDPAILKLSIVVIVTFGLGAIGLVASFRDKREVIVYQDRQQGTDHQSSHGNNEGESGQFNFNGVQQAIGTLKGREALQAGLNTIAQQLEAGVGAIYLTEKADDKRVVRMDIGFALTVAEGNATAFEFGEGLVGQVAASGNLMYVDEIQDGYINIMSGLGSASPRYLVIAPLKKGNEVVGVLEIACFHQVAEPVRQQIEKATQLLAAQV